MTAKEKIEKGEKWLLEKGLYVTLPINTQILLTQSERDVLHTIRHLSRIGYTTISYSLLSIYTGLTDKTMKKAIDSLKRMNIIKELYVCNNGTRYNIDYKVYNNIVLNLNNEFNPIERLRIADRFRGEGHELHGKTIERYTGSEFDGKRM